jgi:ABC-type transport system involved in multi-copper enzyme maturation permease subunit
MRAVLAIARNTFREAIRDRILYLFLCFAVLLIVASKVFGMLTVGEEGKIIKDLGLGAIQFFSMLIAVLMSVLLVSREIERRTVFNILAKPVRRGQFLLGKYLGLMAVIALNILLMALSMVVLVAVYQSEWDFLLLFQAAMILLEMAVLCAFAVLFSVVTKPILGSVLTLAVFVIGHLTESLWLLADRLKDQVSQFLIAVFYYILPNLERFNFKMEVVHKLEIPMEWIGLAVLYAAVYSAIALLLAWLQLRYKDLV